MLSHREVFTQRSFYMQKLLHTEAFIQRSLYTEALLHKVETWNWQQFFRKNLRRSFREQAFPTCSKKKPQFHDSMNTVCSNKHKEYISEAAGPHSIAFKPTLRWHRGSSNPAEPAMSVSSKIFCLVNANPLLWTLTSTHYWLQKLDYDIFNN